jgi:chromosome segregation ATPase
MKEVENKAPQIQQQKINYEKLIVAYNDLSTKFQELSSTKDSLSAQVQTLHDSESALKDEKTDLQRESSLLSAQVRTLAQENSRLKNGGVSVPTAPLTFNNVEELHTQNLQLLATLRKVQEESKQQVSSALSAAKREIEQQKQTISRLTSDLAATNLALENARAKAAQAIPENYVNLELFYSQKREELNQLRLDKARLESENNYLSQRIQGLEQSTIHLRAESDNLRHEKSALLQQINYLEHDLEQGKTELLSEKSARNRLTLELETSKQLQDLANSSQERAQSELKRIQEVYFAMLDNSEALERHFAEKQKEKQDEIHQLISEKSNLFALYKQREAELNSIRSKWNEEVCKLKAELENYKLAVNYPLNLEKIGGELQDAYSLNNQLTAQLTQLTEEHSTLQANYHELLEQVERYRQMFSQAESSNMSMEELNTLRSEILMLRNELAKKEREIVGYEEEIRHLKNSVLEFQRTLTDSARNLAEYSAEMSSLSEEMQNLKMTLKQANEDRNNLVLDVESLKGQLVSNKQEMKNSILEKQRLLAGGTKEEPSSEEVYLKEEFAKAEKRAQDLESRCSSLSAELEECRREALSRPEVMHRLLSVVHKAYKLSQSQ